MVKHPQTETEADEDAAPKLFVEENRVFADSREVAQRFKKRNSDVLRAIRKMDLEKDFFQANFALRVENQQHRRGARELEYYTMTKDGFVLLVMGFTGAAAMVWKVRYLKTFNLMEAEVRDLEPTLPRLKLAEAARREFDSYMKIAKTAGLEGVEALQFANKGALASTGVDRLAASGGAPALETPAAQENDGSILTVADVAEALFLPSLQAANNLLTEGGFQRVSQVRAGRISYQLTNKGGEAGGVSWGRQGEEIRWEERILVALRAESGSELVGEIRVAK